MKKDAQYLASLEIDAAFPFELARPVKLLALDVDGILTDGGLYYAAGGLYLKNFNTQDGIGVKLLQKAGVEVAIISGMESPSVMKRAETLGITECFCGKFEKIPVLEDIMRRLRLGWENVAYAGDDWLDLPVLSRVGLALTVADAQPEIRGVADYVSPQSGGKGAVRQFARHILSARGVLADLLKEWTDDYRPAKTQS